MTGTSREITAIDPMALDLPFSPESAGVARQQLVEWMRHLGAGDETSDDARLVVSELVGNAVRHARPLADGTMRVALGLPRPRPRHRRHRRRRPHHARARRGRGLRPRRPRPGDRRDPRRALVGREHPLPHHRARPARPGLTATGPARRVTPSLRAWERSLASAPAPPRATPYRRGSGRPPPALPVRLRPPLQGLPRQRGRSAAGLRRPPLRRACPGEADLVAMREFVPVGDRTADASADERPRACCCARCSRRRARPWSARTAPSGSGSRSSTRTATRAATSPPC